jgi:hypothetical protein
VICAFLLFCSVILHSNDYVSFYPGTVTQIEAPAVVLLAHDFADGKYFQQVDGEIYMDNELYTVTERRYTSIAYIPPEIYDPEKLLLMTCAGDGRLIIIAEKP